MSYLDVLKTCYKKSFTIEGRASRSEFWLFQLHLPILSIVVIFFFEANAPDALLFLLTIFFWLLLFASIPAYFCLTIRRLHDIGYTGWVILPFLFPIFGWALGLLFCLLPSGKENRYDLESGTYETQNSGNLVKERIGMDKNVNRYNIENNALLLPIAMVFGLILIFAGGFSQANVSMAIERCGDVPLEPDTNKYAIWNDCLEDAQTKSDDATRMSALGFVISLLVIYLRITRLDI